jgi:putative SOS response-associated peptidase YedK
MCGRYTLRTPAERLKSEFRLRELPPVEARYNISPTQDILAVRQVTGEREAALLKWGLIPSWAKDDSMSARLINARSETVAEKPAFREAFRRNRCVIPADGAYEWKRGGGGRKQPFYFRMRDGRPFGFAGLWDRWSGQDGEVIESCTILTTEANEIFLEAHERMPVILPPETYDVWLDEGVRDVELLKGLLRPYPSSEMTAYPVSARVNSPQNQGAELIEKLRVAST